MNELTTEQKLWLARQVPELIEVCNNPVIEVITGGDATWFMWSDTAKWITDREWPYIVSLVEEKLKHENGEIKEYLYELEKSCIVSGSQARIAIEEFKYITATPSQRTTALMKVLK